MSALAPRIQTTGVISFQARVRRYEVDSPSSDSTALTASGSWLPVYSRRPMKHTIRATDLARNLGDVLSRVRYRRDSFVIERYGNPVARIVPVESEADDATFGEVLSAWCDGAAGDHAFAEDLDAVDASDKTPVNRWQS